MTFQIFAGTSFDNPDLIIEEFKGWKEAFGNSYVVSSDSICTGTTSCRESCLYNAERMRNVARDDIKYLWVGSWVQARRIRKPFVNKLIEFSNDHMNKIVETQGIETFSNTGLRILSDDEDYRLVIYGPVKYDLNAFNLIVLSVIQSITKGITGFIADYNNNLLFLCRAMSRKELTNTILLSSNKASFKRILNNINNVKFDKKTLGDFARQLSPFYNMLTEKNMRYIFKKLETERVSVNLVNGSTHGGPILFFNCYRLLERRAAVA